MSEFSLEPTGVTPPTPLSERPTVWRRVAIGLAVLCVALSLLLFRATGGVGSPDGGPAAKVAMACTVVSEIGAEFDFSFDDDQAPTKAWVEDGDRLWAALSLAELAAKEDPAYAELSGILSLPMAPDSPEDGFLAMRQKAEDYCADH